MKERLRTLMQLYSINQTELAQKIGVSKMTISHIMSDSGRGGGFKQETIDAIKRAFPTLDINWLITGVGTAPLPIDETSLFSHTITPNNDHQRVNEDTTNNDIKTRITTTYPIDIEPNTLQANANLVEDNVDLQPGEVVQSIFNTESRSTQEPEKKLVEKQITRIVLFYSDGTFKDYRPE